jgi:nicotinate-nucleotide adenylyltransferase
MKNKIAILGGTFDPIHNGHIGIAHQIIKKKLVDQVIYLPAAIPPHKQGKKITNSVLRLKMIQSVLDDQTTVSDFEIQQTTRISYSEQTMNQLREIYSDSILYFFMGMDSLRSLHHWRNFITFIENNQFIVYTRKHEVRPTLQQLTENFNQRQDLAQKMLLSITELPNFDISSTQIREAIRMEQSIDNLVPQSVQALIIENQLYKKD